MDKLSFLIAIIACCACSSPTADETPGDEQVQAWEWSPRECEPTVVDCEDGVLEGPLSVTEDCITFERCTIDGNVVVLGEFPNANHIDPERSREPGYVDWVKEQAPESVAFLDCEILGAPGKVSLYVGPGAKNVSVVRTRIVSPDGGGPTVYLGAESSGAVLEDCEIDATHSDREAIAIDASFDNRINDCSIIGGGVRLYRNCGEGGVTRHATPSSNRLTGNTLGGHADGVVIGIWLSSRDVRNEVAHLLGEIYHYGFCDEDSGADVGSSGSDFDWARNNIITGNSMGGSAIVEGWSASGNTVEGNR